MNDSQFSELYAELIERGWEKDYLETLNCGQLQNLFDSKQEDIRRTCSPKNCGASPLACEIAAQLFALDGFAPIRSQEFAASCARVIDHAIDDWKRESRQQQQSIKQEIEKEERHGKEK